VDRQHPHLAEQGMDQAGPQSKVSLLLRRSHSRNIYLTPLRCTFHQSCIAKIAEIYRFHKTDHNYRERGGRREDDERC
jgi:hypothetical protein